MARHADLQLANHIDVSHDLPMTSALDEGPQLRTVAFPAAALELRVTKARLCELVLARNLPLIRLGAGPASWHLMAGDVASLAEAAAAPPLPQELEGLRPGAAEVFRLLADWGGEATTRQLEAGVGASFTSVWRNLMALKSRRLVDGARNAPWVLTEAGRAVADRWAVPMT